MVARHAIYSYHCQYVYQPYSGGMHVKVTSSGSRQYVQLVESFRDPGGKVKKRTVATLGRLDQIAGDLDSDCDAISVTECPESPACRGFRLSARSPLGF